MVYTEEKKDTDEPMSPRLLIVANRLPLTVTESNEEKVEYKASAGGLATGLASLKVEYEKHWIGWPGVFPEKDGVKKNIEQTLEKDNIHPVFLSEHDMEYYYNGFSNGTIWPLFHYFTDKVKYNQDFWEVYKTVNERFCDEVLRIARPNDIIWVHDYQLMLLPKLLREKLPDAQIGYFLHITFPSFEIYRTLPWRADLLEGLLGADLIGLHTSEYMRHFLSSVYRVLGHESYLGTIKLGNRIVQVDTHPMGIDYDKFNKSRDSKEVQDHMKVFRKQFGERKLVLSVDRLDYSKGILQRLVAFDQFLEQHPEFAEKIYLMVVVVPSRENIDTYKSLKEEIDKMVGQVNGKHATINWTPVDYYYRSLPFEELVAWYRTADVALFTPFRDGMNLIAKEFVASKKKLHGVLILSEMAGAAEELPQALHINPNDVNDIVRALGKALHMPEDEQAERLRGMQRNLQRQTVKHWANQFMKELADVHEQQQLRKKKELTSDNCKQLLNDFRAGKERLILLDYDGTLVPFVDQPEKAAPDQELIGLLEKVTALDNTRVVIISGRDHHTLCDWLGKLDVGLIAEHGSWYREESGEWRPTKEPELGWKEELYPIFEEFADKTPGSFVEEKPFSLVWHYRNTDAWIADLRAQGLINALVNPCTKNGLQVLTGNKVVEVRVSGMDKGAGTQTWLDKKDWDFVLACGDDVTDEDMFKVLPQSAYSIKVGYDETAARFETESNENVRQLLKQLVDGKC